MGVAHLGVDDGRRDVANHVARDVDDHGDGVHHAALVRRVAGDVVRDVAAKVIDGEVRDVHAGGDPVRTMEAPCNVPGTGPYAGIVFARFSVPGLDPRTAGEVHARVCGYTCAGDAGLCVFPSVPGGADCIDTTPYSSAGSVTVWCGAANGDRGTTARVWLH